MDLEHIKKYPKLAPQLGDKFYVEKFQYREQLSLNSMSNYLTRQSYDADVYEIAKLYYKFFFVARLPVSSRSIRNSRRVLNFF